MVALLCRLMRGAGSVKNSQAVCVVNPKRLPERRNEFMRSDTRGTARRVMARHPITRRDHEKRISSARRRCSGACTPKVVDRAGIQAGGAGFGADPDRVAGGARMVWTAGGGAAGPGNGAGSVGGGAERSVGPRRTGDPR